MKWNKSHLYTLLIVGVMLGGVLLFGDVALAQPDLGLDGIDTGLGNQDIRIIIANIIRALLGFLGILAVVIIMYGGFVWMGAMGSPEKVQKAQSIIINGVIGLVIILSSLAITQFLINAIGGATGLNTSSTSPTSSSAPTGTNTFNNGFSLNSVSPSGTIGIRNAQVRVRLSSPVDRLTVGDNVVVRPVGATTPEAGTIGYAASDTIITFTPSTPCPLPNSSEGCFDYDDVTDAGVAYEVLLYGGLRGTNGLTLACGPAGCNPAGSFVTGPLVDLTPPSVTITFPSNGAGVSLNPEVPITIQVTDDSGVADVEALVDSATVGTDAPSVSAPTFAGTVTWIDTGLIAQSTHILDAIATDIAGRSADSANISVIARPEHCFDGIANFGESDPPGDCGGDPTSLDYCGACADSDCFTNADCSAGLQCIDGACILLPEILGVSPADGAVGNFITISGINFGNASGSVRFLGDPTDPSDDLTAGLACSNSWLDDEVIVEIPDPATVGLTPATYPTGPIEIGIFNGEVDATNDAFGPLIDFEINTIERPGLCSVTPQQAATGDVVALAGTNLGDGTGSFVFFDTAIVSAISNWTETVISAAVPTLTLDPFLKPVRVQKGLEYSNPVSFGIDPPDLGPTPTIQYIDTASAPIDGMVTIFGSNFGFQEGNVIFTDPTTNRIAYGSNAFPAECAGGTWNTSSITIKIPSAYRPVDAVEPFAPGAFNVHIVRTDSAKSDPVGFTVSAGLPGPGICRVTPISGPENIIVDLYGENFGSSSDTVTFTGGTAINMPMWTDGHIQATVPLAATTGPMSVTAATVTSNQVAFEVGECAVSPNSCQTSYRCCSSTLSCELILSDNSECDLAIPTPTNYLFEWVTGPVPVVPRVKIACQALEIVDRTVSPTPWGGRVGGSDVCINSLVSAEFTVNVDNIGASTVTVNECIGSDADDPCDELGLDIVGAFNIQSNWFSFNPTVDWTRDTTYQVQINTGIVASGDGGLPMSAPFVWEFKTRDSVEPCEISAITMFPGRHTLTEQRDADADTEGNERVGITATGIGDDICVLLDISSESIAWTTANNTVVPGPFALELAAGNTNADQVAIALAETVTSSVSVFATLILQNVAGLSLINVNFTDPVVQNYWPNCDVACINAQIGAQFNVPMLPLTTSNVHLESCLNEFCATGNSPVVITLPPLTNNGKDQIIDPTPELIAGMFYRVTIDGSARSVSGAALTGMNYDGDTSFSWVFRVNPDGAFCTVDRVEMAPDSATMRVIGERQAFASTPYGPPDSCSDGGQRLEWSDYNWAWASSQTSTAFLLGTTTPGDFDLGQNQSCNGSCLLNGSVSGVSVCGNGGACTLDSECSFNETCSGSGWCIEYGEQCDDGNNLDGDGCTSSCVWEGTDSCEASACSITSTVCTTDTDCEYGDTNVCVIDPNSIVASVCAITGTACTEDASCELVGGSCEFIGTNCCGNGVAEPFEECEDSNTANGDGCSERCTNEGSALVGATCGNFDIAHSSIIGGEECDDGNTVGGDGCSGVCLWEGSSSASLGVCGNGVIEPGEECDDSNTSNGDGCTNRCIYDGGVLCDPSSPVSPCCGDGTVNDSNFEQCDGGATGEEGCTASCLLRGSSIEYSIPSICGDGSADFGEHPLCESNVGDGRIDGIQYAEVSTLLATQLVPTDGLYTTDITARAVVTQPKTGTAVLNVECSCEASLDCPTAGAQFACGVVSGCCSARPELPTYQPVNAAIDQCRNVEVRIIFEELMDHSSMYSADEVVANYVTGQDELIPGTANILLQNTDASTAEDCEELSGHTYLAKALVDIEYLPQFANDWLTDILRWIRPAARALPQGCYIDAAPITTDINGHTEVVLRYTAALAPNANYSISLIGDANPLDAIEEGVRTVSGAGYNADGFASAVIDFSVFSTQAEICELNYVSMVDTEGNGVFNTADDSHLFQVAGMSQQGAQLVNIIPITGVYDWDYTWTVPSTSEIIELDGTSVNDYEEGVSSLQTNGQEYVSAIATITDDSFFDPDTIGDTVGTSALTWVYICEIPWPGDKDSDGLFDQFKDTSANVVGLSQPPSVGQFTNFQTGYCRAVVAPEPEITTTTASLGISVANAQAQVDVLPNFIISEPSVFTRTDVVRDIFLRHPSAAEVIGIRVLENPDFMPLQQWYAEQGFTGAPKATVVAGYNAISDGRTIYINGVNRDPAGNLEPLIYVISYSENAGPETVEVFNQIVDNFSLHASTTVDEIVTNTQICMDTDGIVDPPGTSLFYGCSTDLECVSRAGDLDAYCDADADKIKRDFSRFEDLRTIEAIASNYGDTHRHCSATTNLICIEDSNCPTNETCNADVPLLDAGTFIRGWSTSAWPSWGAELGNELASGLPVDPVNRFGICSPQPGICSTSSAISCTTDDDCPSTPATEFDAATSETCLNSGFDSATCWDGNESIHQCPADSHVYRYQRSGIEGYTLAVDLEATDFEWTDAFSPLTVTDPTDAQPIFLVGGLDAVGTPAIANTCTGSPNYGDSQVCGDGVIGGVEICELGQTSVESCTLGLDTGVQVTNCASDCLSFVSTATQCIPFSCGNGVVEGVCDDNHAISCLSDAVCGADGPCIFDYSVAGVEQCDDGEFNGLYGYCGTDCTNNATTSLQCGNGVVEGPETCDCGNNAASMLISGCANVNGVYDADGNITGDSCAWNCIGPAPFCGDGIATGGEQCDTEFESWEGALCVGTESPCSDNSDCPTGVLCGNDSTLSNVALQACPQAGFCSGGDHPGDACNELTGDLTAASGNCADANTTAGNPGVCTTFDTIRTRSCTLPPAVTQCNWATWSGCEQQGACGNGIPEAGEECDDGNSVNTDSCTNVCQSNVCGDGFLYPAQESCDLGTSNGVLCDPSYSGTCSYCTPSCSYQTLTGGYCGDGEVQASGGEICDGSAPLHWVVSLASDANYGDVGGVCYVFGATLDADSNTTFESRCRPVGACNGGEDNGDTCIPGIFPYTAINACAGGNTCVTQQCDNGCGSACPFNYQTIYAQATESWTDTDAPLVGANPTDTVTLFSSSSAGECFSSNIDFQGIACHSHAECGAGGICENNTAPDYASLTVPECSVASGLQADVSFNFNYRPLEVVFVLDYSGSMGAGMIPNVCESNDKCSLTPTVNCTEDTEDVDCVIQSPTREEAMEAAVAEAVEKIIEEYPGPDPRIGLVTFGGTGNLDEPNVADAWHPWLDISGVSNYNSLWGTGASAGYCIEPYRASDSTDKYDYALPDEWSDIAGNGEGISGEPTSTSACIRFWPDNDYESLDLAIAGLPENGGGTPTAAGLNRAMYMLQQFPADHERVIILMSDGAPGCDNDGKNVLPGNNLGPGGDPILHWSNTTLGVNGDAAPAGGPPTWSHESCQQVVQRVYAYSAAIKNQGIKLYSALFMNPNNTVGKRAVRSFQIFSSDCSAPDYIQVGGVDGLGAPVVPSAEAVTEAENGPDIYYGVDSLNSPYGTLADRTYVPYAPSSTGVMYYSRFKTSNRCNDPFVYSYAGDSADAFTSMFDNIVDNIVGTTVQLTPASGSNPVTSVVAPGIGISIPLPPGFVCQSTPQDIDVSIDFAGEGTVTIGNFRFLHCSE